MAKSSRNRPTACDLILRMRSRHLNAFHVSCSCTMSLYLCNTSVCFLLIAYHVGCFKKVLLDKCGYWHQMTKDIQFTQCFMRPNCLLLIPLNKGQKSPNSMFWPNGKFLWPSGSEKPKIGKFGLKKAKLVTLLSTSISSTGLLSWTHEQ